MHREAPSLLSKDDPVRSFRGRLRRCPGGNDIFQMRAFVPDYDFRSDLITRRHLFEDTGIVHLVGHCHRRHEARNCVPVDIDRMIRFVDRYYAAGQGITFRGRSFGALGLGALGWPAGR